MGYWWMVWFETGVHQGVWRMLRYDGFESIVETNEYVFLIFYDYD